MEEIVARGIQILLALAGAYLVALWFVLVVWTYRDVEHRSRSVITQVFSTLLVVLFYVPGVLLYMILRPKETLDAAFQRSLEEEYLLQDLEELPLCHSCQRYVEDDFVLCPHCQTTLREPCVSCGRLVHLRWSLCPYCGTEQNEKAGIIREIPAAPAARWRSSSGPRRRPEPVVIARPHLAPRPAEAEEAMVAAAVAVEQAAPAVAATALTVVREESVATPLRLFDRRKTRAASQSGTLQTNNDGPGSLIRSLVNGNGRFGANGSLSTDDASPAIGLNGSDTENREPVEATTANEKSSRFRRAVALQSRGNGD